MMSASFANSEEDWNDIFLTRDIDGNEEEIGDSDSDYEDTPLAGMPVLSDSEGEDDTKPSIHYLNNQALRSNLRGKNLAEPIRKVLTYMDALGINVPIFLDGLSWGSTDCTMDAKIRYARSALMNSEELPGILRRWWKPPRPEGSKKRRPKGARQVIQAFVAECMQDTLDRELEAVAPSLLSPVGEDIREEFLTSLVFEGMIENMKASAPTVWKLLYALAYTPYQQMRNTEKNPDKVSTE